MFNPYLWYGPLLVVPEIVIERDDGYKAVNYQKLTALLVQAVKELKEEIKELKKDK